jgi:hypothetical protein
VVVLVGFVWGCRYRGWFGWGVFGLGVGVLGSVVVLVVGVW